MIETKTYRTWEERQHPDGYPPIQMKEVTAMVDEIEQLRARIRELESYNLGLANESHAQQSRIKELEAENAELRAEVYCNQMCVRFWPSHHSNCRLLAIRLNRIKQQAD